MKIFMTMLDRIIRSIFDSEKHYGYYGDIKEIFFDIAEDKGSFKALFWLFMQIARGLPSLIANNMQRSKSMLKNYLKMALRKIHRQKGYSFINIFGLTIGLTCFILVAAFVRNELSYDKYHENAEDLYYISKFYPDGTGSGSYGITPAPLAQHIKTNYPEVLNSARIIRGRSILVKFNSKIFFENSIYFTDQDLLDIFTVELIHGNKTIALSEPNSIIISQKIAQKYFGQENPIGKNLLLNNRSEYNVTGVFQDLPFNTHFRFDMLCTLASTNTGWNSNSFYTYARLKPNTSKFEFQEKLQILFNKILDEENTDEVKLIPVTEMYLLDAMEHPIQPNGDPPYIYILSIIGFALLIIATFNYVNLSVAHSASRITEITLRKVVGAKRGQLIIQFIGESTLTVFIAFVFAIIIAVLFAPAFSSFLERNIDLSFLYDIKFITLILGLTAFTGIISGFYPGVLLSSIKPEKIIKGFQKRSSLRSTVRNSLVSIQFAVSMVLILCTIVIFQQLSFINNKDLGFRKNQIVTIPVRVSDGLNGMKVLKEEFKKNPSIQYCTNSTFLPNNIQANDSVDWDGKAGDTENMIWMNYVGANFLETYGIELVMGSGFARLSNNSDTDRYIVNETAVKDFGWDSPIGKSIRLGDETGIIVGVMKNFHSRKLNNKVEPLVLIFNENYHYASTVSVQINLDNTSGTIKFLENKFKEVYPNFPFRYNFLEDMIYEQYKMDQKLFYVILYLAIIVLFTSCLGLYGFASHSVENRKKEISIRKVLGSSSKEVLSVIAKEHLLFVTIAFIISWPVSWYIMSKWLEQFAYRMELGILPFLYSGLTAYLIALLTIGYKSYKAATANPVDSLRYE